MHRQQQSPCHVRLADFKACATRVSVCLQQAYGSGNLDALPIIFQRSVAFMLAHCVPLSGLLLLAPRVLDLVGEPSPLCAAVRRFMLLLLPLLWLDAVDRFALPPVHTLNMV